MSATIKTIIDMWARPKMRVRKIKVLVNTDNFASMAVFKKNDFTWEKTIHNAHKRPTEDGEEITDVHVLEWRETGHKEVE